jgi:hypothetical protein
MRFYSGPIGDEMLPVGGYRDGKEDLYGLLSGLVLFRLVAPPLNPGAVGPYPIRGAWFPSHLPLEGTGHI